MSCVPLESRKFEPQPQEYLSQMVTLIGTLRGGESRYLPLVTAKIRDTLPGMGSGMQQRSSAIGGSSAAGDGTSVGGVMVKQEGSEGSGGKSPFEQPPFMHFYPLA